MKPYQQSIERMNQLLGELVQVATKLRDLSFQVISEEELMLLQKRQEELMTQLEEIDQDMHNQLDVPMREHFHHQIQLFQQLNQEFIQNLEASHGIIQFDLEETGERSPRLNKSSSSPDSSQAIEPKEDEES